MGTPWAPVGSHGAHGPDGLILGLFFPFPVAGSKVKANVAKWKHGNVTREWVQGSTARGLFQGGVPLGEVEGDSLGSNNVEWV